MMAKFELKVQRLLYQSSFGIGDLVKYSIDLGEFQITYLGNIASRIWVDEGDSAYWQYEVDSHYRIWDGNLSNFDESDIVLESALNAWDGRLDTLCIDKKHSVSISCTMKRVPT